MAAARWAGLVLATLAVATSGPGLRAQGAAARRDSAPPALAALTVATALADTVLVFRAEAVDPADTTAQAVVIELRIGRLARATVPAYRVRTEALVPLTQFLQMAEILFSLAPDGRLEATVDPGRVVLRVDASSDTLSYGARRLTIDPAFKRFEDDELYVGAERLADLLGLRITVDWNELVVSVVDASSLPIGRRLQREAAREAFLRRRAAGPAQRVLGLERTRWGGVVLDYSLFLPSTAPLDGGTYSGTLGADLFGGSLEAAALSRNGIESGQMRFEGSWSGVWRDSRWLKQLSVGDAFSTGPRLRQLQGVSVTNSPYVRPSLVGSYRYGGRIEPGWVVEAYRGGQLIALDSADAVGGYGFDLPAYYGENPVDLVAYGPFGEIRSFNQTYRVLPQLLPAGQFEYGASLGDCRSTLCDATGNLDVRYGVSRRWTVRGGLEQLWRDTVSDLTQPYASISGTPVHALAVEVEALAQGFVRAGVNVEPSLHLRVAGDVAAYDPDTPGPSLTPQGRLREWGLAGFVRPIPAFASFYFEGGLRQTTSTAGAFTQGRVGASYQAAEVRFLPYVRLERTTPTGGGATQRAYAGLNVFMLPRLWWRSFWGALWARGDAEIEDGRGLRTAAAVVGRELWDGVRLEVGARYQREVGGTSLVATLQTYLPGARTTTAVDAPPGGTATGSFLLQGSAVYNEAARGVGFTPGPSIQRSGLTGQVFVDDNANGRWDTGESAAPDVRVRVGNFTAVSDSSGSFRLWGLLPFEPVLMAIDTFSIASPLLVPAYASASVAPSPNRFRTVDIPLVHAGVVEGQVRLITPTGERALGGVSVVLVDRVTGARQTVITFSDGGFYVLGVRPGDYDVAVDARIADAFGATAEPARVTVAPDGTVAGPPLVELRLIQDR